MTELTVSDLRVGDCFRFIGPKPWKPEFQYADTVHNPNAPFDLPNGWDAMNIDDQSLYKNWWAEHAKDPIELLEHYQRSAEPLPLTRGCIKDWECFSYICNPQEKFIRVPNETYIDMPTPDDWSTANGRRIDVDDRAVRRIPRWDHIMKWSGNPVNSLRPTVLGEVADKPRVAEPFLETVSGRTHYNVNGLTGEQCLERLQRAMQTESLCRVGNGFVSTLGGEGLDAAQVELGWKVWREQLAELRAAAEAKAAAHQITVLIDHGEIGPWKDWE